MQIPPTLGTCVSQFYLVMMQLQIALNDLEHRFNSNLYIMRVNHGSAVSAFFILGSRHKDMAHLGHACLVIEKKNNGSTT